MASRDVTTTAFILNTYELGEYDIAADLITAELGRVRAISTGVRKLSSKLRYTIQPYAVIEASIIDSRSGWRLINAVLHQNLFYELNTLGGAKHVEVSPAGLTSSPPSKTTKHLLARFTRLLRRVIPPDEIYPFYTELVELLVDDPELVIKHNLIVVGYILEQLGYLDLSKRAEQDTKALTLKEAIMLLDTNEMSATLQRTIPQALQNSQL